MLRPKQEWVEYMLHFVSKFLKAGDLVLDTCDGTLVSVCKGVFAAA